MADNVWDNSDGDNNGNVAANWSLGHVPTTGDVAVFDSATTNANCTLSGDISCDGMRFDNAYSGSVDFATHNVSLGANGLDCTGAGSGALDLGSGSHSTSGDLDIADVGTFTRGTAAFDMTGTGTVYNASFVNRITVLTISGSSSIAVDNSGAYIVAVTGTLTTNVTFLIYVSLTCSSGTLTGSGEVRDALAGITYTGGGTWSVATTTARRGATINAGTYGGSWAIAALSGTRTTALNGTIVFTSSVSIDADVASQTFTIDNSSNPSITFEGDLTLAESAGTLVWTAGTGTITFAGTGDQTVTTPASWTDELEDIVIDKGNDTAKVALDGDVYTQSFTGTQGRFDLNGYEVHSSGSVSCLTTGGFQFHNGTDNDMGDVGSGRLNGLFDIDGGSLTLTGTSGTHLEIDNLDFDLASGVTGTALYCDVINSTCTYVTSEIDATDASNTDDGGNTGWDFVGDVSSSSSSSTISSSSSSTVSSSSSSTESSLSSSSSSTESSLSSSSSSTDSSLSSSSSSTESSLSSSSSSTVSSSSSSTDSSISSSSSSTQSSVSSSSSSTQSSISSSSSSTQSSLSSSSSSTQSSLSSSSPSTESSLSSSSSSTQSSISSSSSSTVSSSSSSTQSSSSSSTASSLSSSSSTQSSSSSSQSQEISSSSSSIVPYKARDGAVVAGLVVGASGTYKDTWSASGEWLTFADTGTPGVNVTLTFEYVPDTHHNVTFRTIYISNISSKLLIRIYNYTLGSWDDISDGGLSPHFPGMTSTFGLPLDMTDYKSGGQVMIDVYENADGSDTNSQVYIQQVFLIEDVSSSSWSSASSLSSSSSSTASSSSKSSSSFSTQSSITEESSSSSSTQSSSSFSSLSSRSSVSISSSSISTSSQSASAGISHYPDTKSVVVIGPSSGTVSDP